MQLQIAAVIALTAGPFAQLSPAADLHPSLPQAGATDGLGVSILFTDDPALTARAACSFVVTGLGWVS
jgi:hypothetical protein